MSAARTESDQERADLADAGDRVLETLEQARREYREAREEWEQETVALAETLDRTRSRLDREQQAREELSQALREREREVEEARRTAEAHRRRVEELRELVKQIHGSLFSGGLYQLILRACLTITHATRGLYITADLSNGSFRVRAAIGIEGYPEAPPSPFLQALCRRVLEQGESLVCNDPEDLNLEEEPAHPGERFRNCVAAPVVLLRSFNGVLLVADREEGDFAGEDVETLLAIGDQAAVAVENFRLQQELQRAYLSTVTMLADAIEAKDPYTGGHCETVARYARAIARQLALDEEQESVACYAALLHDVGKIGVSDGVLNKPGPLLPEERDLVRAHVRVGHDLIAALPALAKVAHGVLHHHEWYDGSGYPDGLKEEEIPIASRIVCVVDAYCAMITRRSYKEAYTHDHACGELRRSAGSQFDPTVVEAFLQALENPDAPDDTDLDLACALLPGFRPKTPL